MRCTTPNIGASITWMSVSACTDGVAGAGTEGSPGVVVATATPATPARPPGVFTSRTRSSPSINSSSASGDCASSSIKALILSRSIIESGPVIRAPTPGSCVRQTATPASDAHRRITMNSMYPAHKIPAKTVWLCSDKARLCIGADGRRDAQRKVRSQLQQDVLDRRGRLGKREMVRQTDRKRDLDDGRNNPALHDIARSRYHACGRIRQDRGAYSGAHRSGKRGCRLDLGHDLGDHLDACKPFVDVFSKVIVRSGQEQRDIA